MKRLVLAYLLSLLVLFPQAAKPQTGAASRFPNIVIIYADDLGYGDVSCFGGTAHETPHIDKMAAGGVKMTSFYVATPSCGPSRAALLTGRYPFRTGVPMNPAPDVLRDHGIKQSETTLAEALKTKGYATKIVGKWHLGHLPEYYPTRHGFDSYLGILYSNDMRPVMLCRDEKVIEYPVVQNYLTKRYTEEALAFIERKKDEPFFLYFPQAMPHKPLAASKDFYTPETPDDLYSDAVRELDWSVGQVLGKLKELGLEENTLVLFSSDNGPTYGGDSGGLRGMKGSGWEGGCRVPGIFYWKGKLEAGRVIDVPCATIDVLPTVCALAGIDTTPLDVDGYDIWPLLSGGGAGPDRAIYVWRSSQLMCVRKGKWKYHAAKSGVWVRGREGEDYVDPRGPDGHTIIAPLEQAKRWHYPSPPDTAGTVPAAAGLLFDLEADRAEQTDLAAANPEVVARLKKLADLALAELEDVEIPKYQKIDPKRYLGPGRITEKTAQPIEEVLREVRGKVGSR